MTDIEEQLNKRATLVEVFLSYLSRTQPVLLLVHLVFVSIICVVLSLTYIVAFHFTSILSVYQESHDIKHFSTNLKASVKQDNEIQNVLDQLMASTTGNRAYVFRYHNGLAAISGVPFFFATNTHEVISPGTTRVIGFDQRIPASMDIAMNNQFMQDKCAIVTRTDEDHNSQHYWYFQSRSAKSLIRCPIFMSNGDIFGFVGVDYTSSVSQDNINKGAQLVKSAASRIGDIFTSK
jgi:hypothetical protein